ncbi:MAG: P-II family nitrogen regulator [Lachnospiraceae bacterium]|nr:P-II family nitrogen regulator [Lachnospiraceae bacterium]
MQLNMVITILDRSKAGRLQKIYEENGVNSTLIMLGHGTATSKHLNFYGLEATEKAVIFGMIGGDRTKQLFRETKREMMIDIPGNGVMMAVPVKSVSGGRTLAYFTNNVTGSVGVQDMNFTQELIIIILNQGYTDDVMDAARSVGAAGGTVVHAKGTGAKIAKKFFGVSLAEEKEVILIAANEQKKGDIMTQIATECGPNSKAGAISFSIPITEIAGIRMLEND